MLVITANNSNSNLYEIQRRRTLLVAEKCDFSKAHFEAAYLSPWLAQLHVDCVCAAAG